MYTSINNYATLFKSMAATFSSKTQKQIFANLPHAYSVMSEYDSIVEEELKYCSASEFLVSIPSSSIKSVIIVELTKDIPRLTNPFTVNCLFRDPADGMMYYIMCIDSSIMYEHSIKRAQLSNFLKTYRVFLSDIISPDEFCPVKFRQLFAEYGALQVLYDNFDPTKEILLKMKEEDRFSTSVMEDNMVFENMLTICTKTNPITEGKIIRAFTEGVQGIEYGNIFKTRPVSKVQESDD